MEFLDKEKKKMEELIQVSTIPDTINKDFVNQLMIDIRKEQLKSLNM